MGEKIGLEALQIPTLGMGDRGRGGRFQPTDIWWQLAREKVMLAGGPSALLMQVAHPLVAAGVYEHSQFAGNPMRRLQATMSAVLTVTFGDDRQAEAVSRRVRGRHLPVAGRLSAEVGRFPVGTAYSADDPELAKWVLATLVWASQATADRLLGPLSSAERSRHVVESVAFGELFGVDPDDWPGDRMEFDSYVTDVLHDTLCVDGRAREIAGEIFGARYSGILRPSPPAIRALTADLLPSEVAIAYGLRADRVNHVVATALTATISRMLPLLPQGARRWPHERVALERLRET